MNGQTFTVKVHLDQKVYELKEYISDIKGIYNIQLKWDGFILHDNKTFSDLDIEDNDFIIASQRSFGGCSKMKL